MNAKLVLVVILSFGLSSQAMADVVDSGDGCHFLTTRSADGSPINVCKETFPGLWVGLAREKGRYIEITGYVAYAFGYPYMFASKDMYLYAAGKGGVRLNVPVQEKELFDQMVVKEKPITVTGLYSQNANRANDRSLGGIDVMPGRFWLAAMPDEPPPSSQD
ncbi:hypothetical protein [Stenotrophomonas sp. PD6]|uniref:hypothetical protein n=1 Tax=Stenotrophomonas sp. PD6 TaxID=3368612 RepID=UPI003B9E5128